MGILDAPALSPNRAAATFQRKNIPGSERIRAMVDAPPMATPPTFSIATSATLVRSIGAHHPALRYSGAPMYSPLGASSKYPREARRLNNTAYQYTGSWRVEFHYTGQAFELPMNFGSQRYIKVWLNGRPHSLTPQDVMTMPGAPTAGATYWLKIDFGSRVDGEVMVEFESPNAGIGLFGFVVSRTDTITPPLIPSPKLMVIGDSYGFGANATWKCDAYAVLLGRMLGWSNTTCQPSVGSTGVAHPGADGVFGNYRSRFDLDVIPEAPDVILYQVSSNDAIEWPAHQGQTGPQMASDLAYLKARLPNAQIFATSPLYTRTPTSQFLAIRDAAMPVAAAAGVPFLDLLDTTLGYFRGSGSVATPAGDGNADFYDVNFHPNSAGHKLIARLIAQWLGPLVGQQV